MIDARRYVTHIAAAIFALAIVVPTVWMALDRAPVLIFYDQGTITPDPVPAGSRATISWEAQQLRKCGGRVTRQLLNLDTLVITDHAWQDVVFRGDDFVRQRYSREFSVPISPGRYEHRAHVERWCNVLQEFFPWLRIRETNSVIRFTVR